MQRGFTFSPMWLLSFPHMTGVFVTLCPPPVGVLNSALMKKEAKVRETKKEKAKQRQAKRAG